MVLYYIAISVYGILAIISFTAGAITHKHVKSTRNRSLAVLVGSWFSWTVAYLSCIVAAIIHLFFPGDFWELVVIGGFFFQILGVFLLILFIDENTKSRITFAKISIISIIGALYLFLPLKPEELEFNEISIYQVHGLTSWVQLCFGLFYFILYIMWIFRMYKHSPKSTKKVTVTLMVVFLISSILAIFAYIGSILYHWVIIFVYLFHGGATLSILVAIRADPRIINILPFVAKRLVVINKHSGVLLYEYSWTEEKDKDLSPFIHGIQKVTEETFQVGSLKSINLDEGLLMLENSDQITYALLSIESTKYLELCFANFVKNFELEISQRSLDLTQVVNTSNFAFGDDLVKDYFKYIPSRKSQV